MTYALYIKTLLILVFMTLLLTVFVYGARLFYRYSTRYHPKKQLSIEEICIIDNKRKVVIMRHNHKRHVMFLGPHQDFIIDSITHPPSLVKGE